MKFSSIPLAITGVLACALFLGLILVGVPPALASPPALAPTPAEQPQLCSRAAYFRPTGNRERDAAGIHEFNLCEQALRKRCTPRLAAEISPEELQTFFSELRRDPRFHAADPGGQCEKRAYLIGFLLNQREKASERIYLEAPAIVGKVLDARGSFLSARHYLWHAAPIVKSRDSSGALRTYVLDPQFFEAPVVLEDYFIAVTGQPCHESALPHRDSDMSCTYVREPANYRGEFNDSNTPEKAAVLQQGCGWSLRDSYESRLRENARTARDVANSAGSTDQVRVDPGLGLERSLLDWALQRFRDRHRESSAHLERKLASVEIHEVRGSPRHTLGDSTEVSPRQLNEWRRELLEESEMLRSFPIERARILRLPIPR